MMNPVGYQNKCHICDGGQLIFQWVINYPWHQGFYQNHFVTYLITSLLNVTIHNAVVYFCSPKPRSTRNTKYHNSIYISHTKTRVDRSKVNHILSFSLSGYHNRISLSPHNRQLPYQPTWFYHKQHNMCRLAHERPSPGWWTALGLFGRCWTSSHPQTKTHFA